MIGVEVHGIYVGLPFYAVSDNIVPTPDAIAPRPNVMALWADCLWFKS